MMASGVSVARREVEGASKDSFLVAEIDNSGPGDVLERIWSDSRAERD